MFCLWLWEELELNCIADTNSVFKFFITSGFIPLQTCYRKSSAADVINANESAWEYVFVSNLQSGHVIILLKYRIDSPMESIVSVL